MADAAGIVVLCPATQQVFLTRRSNLVSSPNVWSVPGGGIEPHEAPLQAAVREFVEETGVLPRCAITNGWVIDGDCVFHMFVGLVTEKEVRRVWREAQLNWESSDAGWFELHAPPSPLHPGMAIVWPELRRLAMSCL